MASVLNLRYLDEVRSLVGPDEPSRLPLAELIQHNALMASASRAGYQTVAVSSDYMATQSIAVADVCVCERRGLDELEHSVLGVTPLPGLLRTAWAYDTHRAIVLDSFEAVESIRATDRPVFVFAHIVAPHPPFVFAEDGTAVSPPRPFGFQDGSHYQAPREEYREGYRAQVEFIAAKTLALVQSLLNRPGPPPVIVVHGDHGPGASMDWNDPGRTNLSERLAVFAAYHFPDVDAGLYPEMTIVNGARLLANNYFGTDLELVEDASWFSTWLRPYDFVPVPRDP